MSISTVMMRTGTVTAAVVVLVGAACSKTSEPAGRAADGYEVIETYDAEDDVAGDEAVLAQLKLAGADLSRPTEVTHYIYFPARQGAEAARGALGSEYEGTVDQPDGSDRFRLAVAHRPVPSIENLIASREALQKVAAASGGTYDGWEAAVTK